jgi:hypothetical protein
MGCEFVVRWLLRQSFCSFDPVAASFFAVFGPFGQAEPAS